MMDFGYYIENPSKIDVDVIIAAKQEKEFYMAHILLRVYHSYLEKLRKKDKETL